MGYSVMFVCTANVCRSPLMAFTLANDMRGAQHDGEWTIASSGTDVSQSSSICDFGASLIADDPGGDEFAESHTSTALPEEGLADFDLIITASRSERAAIARMHPALRSRTFTLREAVALGEAPVRPNEGELAATAAGNEPDLAAYASVLNGRRGTVTWPRERRFGAPWVQRPDPRDLPDVHHESHRVHAATLKLLGAEARVLSSNIRAFLPEGQRST